MSIPVYDTDHLDLSFWNLFKLYFGIEFWVFIWFSLPHLLDKQNTKNEFGKTKYDLCVK